MKPAFDLRDDDELPPDGVASTELPESGSLELPHDDGINRIVNELSARLRRRWILATVLFIVLAGGSLALVLATVRPRYTSACAIFVNPIVPSVAYAGEDSKYTSSTFFYTPYVETLTRMIAIPPVLLAAASKLTEEGVPWQPVGLADNEVLGYLRGNTDVVVVRGTNLVTLSFSGEDPRRLAPVVNAIAEKFLEHLRKVEETETERRLKTLAEERARLETKLRECQRRVHDAVLAAGGSLVDKKQDVLYDRIQSLEKDLTAQDLKIINARGKRETARRTADDLRKPVPPSDLEEAVSKDSAVEQARELAVSTRNDIEKEVGNLKENHPARIAALARLAAATNALRATEEQARKRLLGQLEGTRVQQADELTTAAQREVEEMQGSYDLLKTIIKTANEEFRGRSEAIAESETQRAIEEQAKADLSSLDGRMNEVRIEARAPGRVTIANPGSSPDQPSEDRRLLWGCAAGAGSALVAAALAILAAGHRKLNVADARPEVSGEEIVRSPKLAADAAPTSPPDDGQELASYSGIELLLRTEDPSDQADGATLLACLGHGREKERISVLVVGAASACDDAVRIIAENLFTRARAAVPAILVDSTIETDANAPVLENLVESHGPIGSAWRIAPRGGRKPLVHFLGSDGFHQRVGRLSASAHVRIVTIPAHLVESSLLCRFAEGGCSAVIVARAGRTSRRDLRRVATSLRSAGVDVTGLVVVTDHDPGNGATS